MLAWKARGLGLLVFQGVGVEGRSRVALFAIRHQPPPTLGHTPAHLCPSPETLGVTREHTAPCMWAGAGRGSGVSSCWFHPLSLSGTLWGNWVGTWSAPLHPVLPGRLTAFGIRTLGPHQHSAFWNWSCSPALVSSGVLSP